MKSAWRLCAVLFLATGLVAQTASAPKSSKTKAAPLTAADVQELKNAIAAQAAALAQQQRQIQELREELHKRDQAVQQAQTTASDAAGKADSAQAQVSQQQQTVADLKSDVTDLKSNVANTVVTLQETQKSVSEAPTSIHVKGITITPGGFLAAETVWRSRALAADVNTPFNNITMPGASQSAVSEFFGSGRQSRVSLLAEGRLKSVKLSGYVEGDFLSAAATSNNNQSDSYSLRQRQAWGQAAFDDGWSFTGGQMWSLVTETKHGMDNRSEALPMTIDAAYTVGFSWARQYGARLVKNFNNKLWLGVSLENAQATLSTHGNAANYLVGSAGASGGVYNPTITTCSTSSSGTTTCTPTTGYAFNPSPDIVVKAAFEPGIGHYEIFGVYSRFRDRVFPCAEASAVNNTTPCGTTVTSPSTMDTYNSSKSGGGFGANARWSFVNKRLDFGLHVFGGNGIGRYGSGGLADTSVHGNGTLDLIRNYQGLATLEWHAPKFDVYLNGGAEYNGRAWSIDPTPVVTNGVVTNIGTVVGYGGPPPSLVPQLQSQTYVTSTFNNSGCYTETLPANGSGFLPGSLKNCTADTRVLMEGTVGFWYRLYNGPKGRVQWGPQFSYVSRNAWAAGTSVPNAPHGLDGMIFTSFRYYLP